MVHSLKHKYRWFRDTILWSQTPLQLNEVSFCGLRSSTKYIFEINTESLEEHGANKNGRGLMSDLMNLKGQDCLQ